MLKDEFKTHFRNVTRIMDCVGCDKCRLWGKVQTSGIGTALKILFEFEDTALEYVFGSETLNLLTSYTMLVLLSTRDYYSDQRS